MGNLAKLGKPHIHNEAASSKLDPNNEANNDKKFTLYGNFYRKC